MIDDQDKNLYGALDDEYIAGVVNSVKLCKTDREVLGFFIDECSAGRLKKVSWSIFRYGEYSFVMVSKWLGEQYISNLNIVNGLKLSIFPELVKVIEYLPNSLVVVVRIPGETEEGIEWGVLMHSSLEEWAKQEAVSDLKKLEEAGYLLRPTFRFSAGMTAKGRVMIPEFELLKKADLSTDVIREIYIRYSPYGWPVERKIDG